MAFSRSPLPVRTITLVSGAAFMISSSAFRPSSAVPVGRQPEIEADQLGVLGAKCGEGAAPVLGEQESEVVTQRVLELRADRLVVADDQQFRLVFMGVDGTAV